MSGNMPIEVWAFDCEWVPDIAVGRVLHRLPPNLPGAEVLRVMWEHGGATPENPQPFLRMLLCRIVSIAVLVRRDDGRGNVKLFLLTLPENPDDASQDERKILERFLVEGVAKHRPQLVGYNSRNADLRILMQRAFINGMQLPELVPYLDAKPWESANNDLMERISGFGKSSTPSLNEIATLSGIPGKLDTTGDDVCGLWYRGERRAIAQYNAFDALSTYLLWLRLTYFQGGLTASRYIEEQRRIVALLKRMIEEDKSNAYLQTYLDAWRNLHHQTNQPFNLFTEEEYE